MKQRLFAALLALCMALALLPGAAWATETPYPVTGGNIYFDATTGVIYHCDESVTEAIIPSEINGIPVTSIGFFAFQSCSNLTSVSIPNSVTTIEGSAFWDCSNLTSVYIPGSVTSIGQGAFWGCNSLTNVSIPDSVTTIEEWAFVDCSSLTSMSIPNGVTTIDERTFSGCNSLTSVSIPDSVTRIGNDAFSGCSSLTSMSIPNNVASIGQGAFSGCSSLANMSIPNSVTNIEQFAFSGCSSLVSIMIPDNVTSIEYAVFQGCSSLTNISIPNGVISIGQYAFSGCSGLTSVTISNSVTSIGEEAFSNCNSLADVHYSGGKSQWEQITISNYGNHRLLNATIHYNSTGPASTPSAPAQPANAVLSPQKLAVDGANVDCEKYNIGGSNYFKLRDLAYVLNGTASQFAVGFDAATSTVSITTGAAYTSNGSELATGVDNSSTAQTSRQTILIDGVERGDLTVYNIGGSNFFQLRELGDALGFAVDFDAASNTAIVRSAQG